MKIMSKKAQKQQAQQQQEQIIKAAATGYTRGYANGCNNTMTTVGLTLGAAVITNFATAKVVSEAYRRKMMKYADNDFNLDKTFAKLSNQLYSMVQKDPAKGYKEFCKFLFKYSRKGFEFYNPDACELIMIAGFDHFRDKVSEMGNLVSSLKGDGAKTIKEAYDKWLDNGVNVFPFGPSAGWKGLLSEDYRIAADLDKFNAIINKYLCGAMTKTDVIEGNQVITRLETQYGANATAMNAQSTMYCAEYCNAHHFAHMIAENVVKICNKANFNVVYNETALVVDQFTDANIGGSPIVITKKENVFERTFNKFFHKDGQRTMVPPQNSTAAQSTPPQQPTQQPTQQTTTTTPQQQTTTTTPQQQTTTTTPQQPQYNSADEDASEQNLKSLARLVTQAKTRNDRKAARNKLSVAIDKHCNAYGYSRTEFVNQMPELKGVC